jgi:hypothetical protein
MQILKKNFFRKLKTKNRGVHCQYKAGVKILKTEYSKIQYQTNSYCAKIIEIRTKTG